MVSSLSEAYSDLLSNRLTDKKKFIDAILALYGFELPENGKGDLLENKIIDGIPVDAKIEYIQKIFDESSVKILGDDIIRDIHKMSFTVDMSDEAFSGNINEQFSRSISYINSQVKAVFDRYTKNGGLTESQALEQLNTKQTAEYASFLPLHRLSLHSGKKTRYQSSERRKRKKYSGAW